MYVLSIIVYVHNIHIWLLCSLIFTNKQRTLLKCVSIQGFIFSEGFCIVFSVVLVIFLIFMPTFHIYYLNCYLQIILVVFSSFSAFSINQHSKHCNFSFFIAVIPTVRLCDKKASILNKFLFYFLIKLANC